MKITYYSLVLALLVASCSCKSYGSVQIKIQLMYLVEFELRKKNATVAAFKKKWEAAMKKKDPSYNAKVVDFRANGRWLKPNDTLKNGQYVDCSENPLQPISSPIEQPFPQKPSQPSSIKIRTTMNRSIYVAPDTSVQMLRIMWLQEMQKWNKNYNPSLGTIQFIDLVKGFNSPPLSGNQDVSELKGIFIKTAKVPCLNRVKAVGSSGKVPLPGTGQVPPPPPITSDNGNISDVTADEEEDTVPPGGELINMQNGLIVVIIGGTAYLLRSPEDSKEEVYEDGYDRRYRKHKKKYRQKKALDEQTKKREQEEEDNDDESYGSFDVEEPSSTLNKL